VLGKLKGMFVVGNSPEAFNAFISDERSRWASLVKSANLKIDE
jgi:tripartite-type tricarboxylate transporter receptor subunit TctC